MIQSSITANYYQSLCFFLLSLDPKHIGISQWFLAVCQLVLNTVQTTKAQQ